MQAVKDWLEKSSEAVRSPEDFFQEVRLEPGYGRGLRFLGITSIAAGLSFGLMVFLLSLSSPAEAATALVTVTLVFAPLTFVVLLLDILLTHLVLKLFGAEKGPDTTLEVMAYPSALTILGWVPLLNIALGLYFIYAASAGLERFQEVSRGAAAASIILGNIIGWITLFLFFFLLLFVLGWFLTLLGI